MELQTQVSLLQVAMCHVHDLLKNLPKLNRDDWKTAARKSLFWTVFQISIQTLKEFYFVIKAWLIHELRCERFSSMSKPPKNDLWRDEKSHKTLKRSRHTQHSAPPLRFTMGSVLMRLMRGVRCLRSWEAKLFTSSFCSIDQPELVFLLCSHQNRSEGHSVTQQESFYTSEMRIGDIAS